MAEGKEKKAKKKKPILLIIILAIVVLIGIVCALLFVHATTAAILYIESGIVEVDNGNGWQVASDEMQLHLNDKVRTSASSSASIALYEGEIIRLEENTEVSIDELSQESITINQKSGSTWNKITKISGIKDYDVETPTTVATVRGTGFGVRISAETDLLVDEGIVNFKYGSDEADVNAGEKAVTGGSIDISALTAEDIAWLSGQKEKDIEILIKLRKLEIAKNSVFVNMIKSAAKITDADIEQGLKDIDDGKLDENELAQKSPIQPPSLGHILKLTHQIKVMKGTA